MLLEFILNSFGEITMTSFFDFTAPSWFAPNSLESVCRESVLFGFISGFGYTEMILFGVIALMLFGSRLPEVARNFGSTYRQLRGKVDEFQREFRDWDRADSAPKRPKLNLDDDEERSEPQTPKFTPPPPDDDSTDDNSSTDVSTSEDAASVEAEVNRVDD